MMQREFQEPLATTEVHTLAAVDSGNLLGLSTRHLINEYPRKTRFSATARRLKGIRTARWRPFRDGLIENPIHRQSVGTVRAVWEYARSRN